MKKLLIASIAAGFLLSACASNSSESPEAQAPQQGNVEVEQALQECRQAVGETADRAAFDACMKSKGFERPAQAGSAPAQ